MKKLQIAVIGHNDSGCTPEHERIAYEVGAEIAKCGAVLVTGGLGGVMRAASRGATEAGGLTLGIIPQDDPAEANEYCQLVVPSGMGLMRDYLNVLSGDGVIVVGGGSGTLSEMCAAYMYNRPIVALCGTGGVADAYANRYLDHRRKYKILGVDTPQQAVKTLLERI